ncbi:hypothetical protein ElyMa_003747800 [Elysia marginata]|uniref:Uncharacterized protein n=1 Tax=Elysia marginata TaxID=1093978 RepID=A0AAV4F9I9_9GAST|nr:hypothetical protein ElyMa_003747800 [Elysia marginata]
MAVRNLVFIKPWRRRSRHRETPSREKQLQDDQDIVVKNIPEQTIPGSRLKKTPNTKVAGPTKEHIFLLSTSGAEKPTMRYGAV